MALSVSIGGSTIANFSKVRIQKAANQRSTCSFRVVDAAGTNHYANGAPVVVSDTYFNKTLFAGFVDTSAENKLYPNPNTSITVTCKDLHYKADKRRATRDFTNMAAGDVATYLLSTYLAAEGVTAGYALKYLSTQADWNTGTLTSVVSAPNVGDGDIELATVGSTASQTENTGAAFALGTLTSVDANVSGQPANQLNLHASSAIKFSGTNQGNLGDTFAYWNIWSGSTAIASGDTLNYDLWISSTSPEVKAGVDLLLSDHSRLTNQGTNAFDQNLIPSDCHQDLTGFANDQWYSRSISLTAFAGLSVNAAYLGLEGDQAGTYTIYVKNIFLKNSLGTVKATIWNGATNPYNPGANSISNNYLVTDNGYTGLTTSSVTVYDKSGTRISPAISIDAAKIVNSSLVSWQASIPANTTCTLYTSIDNKATWQQATFKTAIANLMPGASVASRTLYTKAVLAITGPSPETTPVVTGITTTVTSSWAGQTKTDATTTADTTADFSLGTFSNCQADTSERLSDGNGDVHLSGITQDFNTDMHGMTIFGGNAPQSTWVRKQFRLSSNGGGFDARARFDSGSWGSYQDFTLQVSFQLTNLAPSSPTAPQCGVVYRTTGWQNGNDTYGYAVMVDQNTISLGHGTNSATGGGVFTSIASISFTTALTPGNWYTLKVVVAGSSHQAYLNDVLYINSTDSTYTAAGQVGLRTWYATSLTYSVLFDDFGIRNALSGYYHSQTLTISGVGTVGQSMIEWNADVPNGATLRCDVSTDGGVNWFTMPSNGGSIPNLGPGATTSGKSLILSFQMTAPNPTATPVLHSWTAWITNSTSVSGTFKTAGIPCTNVGRAYSDLLTVNSLLPGGTSLSIDASLNGTTWTNMTSSAPVQFSQALPSSLIYLQPDPWLDFFPSDSSANYTSGSYNTGANATWTWDAVNARLVGSGGTRGVLKYTSLSQADGYVEATFNYSDGGGLVGRMVDSTHLYYLVVNDGSTASGQQTLKLFKQVGTTATQLGTTQTINFVRNEFHTMRLDCQGTTISVTYDGTQLLSVTDASVTGAGQWGYAAGAKIQAYTLRVQAYGDNASPLVIYVRLTLNSTTPSATPQILDCTLSVHNANIGNGVTIPQTSGYAYKHDISQDLDDLVNQCSNYYWLIDENSQLLFQQRTATPAPLYMWSGTANAPILWSANPVTVSRPDMNYRNRQIIDGGYDNTVVVPPETLHGDGFTQTWTLTYPVDSITSITLDGQPALVGVRGVDTGKDFYYQVGGPTITQDTAESPLISTDTLIVSYVPQVPTRVIVNNTGQFAGTTSQSQMAAIDGTSGIVENYVSMPGLNIAAATAQANGLLQQNGKLARTINFSTNLFGLAPGQLLCVNSPEYQIVNSQFLITSVTITADQAPGQSSNPLANPIYDGVLYWHNVQATEGPDAGNWVRVFKKVLQAL